MSCLSYCSSGVMRHFVDILASFSWTRSANRYKKNLGQHSMGGHRIPLEYPLTKNKSEWNTIKFDILIPYSNCCRTSGDLSTELRWDVWAEPLFSVVRYEFLVSRLSQYLGPLHMSPVDRAGSVSEISPRRSFLYKNFDVFIWEGGLAR